MGKLKEYEVFLAASHKLLDLLGLTSEQKEAFEAYNNSLAELISSASRFDEYQEQQQILRNAGKELREYCEQIKDDSDM